MYQSAVRAALPVLLLAGAASGPVSAQVGTPAAAPGDTIRVGTLGSIELHPGADSTMTYAVRDGERRPMMLYVETVSDVPEGHLIVGENIRPDGRSVTLDSVVVARGTLAPLRHSDVTPSGRTEVRLEGGRVIGTAVDTLGQATAIDAPATPGAFDYSMTGMILGHLPLRSGYAAVVLTHDIKRGMIPLTVRVLGEEEITAGGRSAKAWKLEVDYGTFKATRWIGHESRKELRTVVNFNGNEIVVEPV